MESQTNKFTVSNALHRLTCKPDTVTGYTFDELKELFSGLTPQAIKPGSRLAGHMTTLAGTSWMPRFLRRFLVKVLNLIIPWSGKGFYGEQGSNLWFGVRSGPKYGHYNVSMEDGLDGKKIIRLNYNNERNPAFLRRIRGEVRLLGPGIHLAEMLWKTRKGYFTIMYFTMTDNEGINT